MFFVKKKITSIIFQLTYRSVSESVQRRRERIWALLDESDHSASDRDARLDDALFAHMYRRAKSDHGMANARVSKKKIFFKNNFSFSGSNRADLEDPVRFSIVENLYPIQSIHFGMCGGRLGFGGRDWGKTAEVREKNFIQWVEAFWVPGFKKSYP